MQRRQEVNVDIQCGTRGEEEKTCELTWWMELEADIAWSGCQQPGVKSVANLKP